VVAAIRISEPPADTGVVNFRRLAAVGLLAIGFSSCGQFDEVASFDIANDGAVAVDVVMCGNTCAKHHEVQRVAPGSTAPFNATVGGPSELFVVRDLAGHMTCLDVLIKHQEPPHVTVATSSAKKCDPTVFRKGSWWDQLFG
jgi:hypothetical protein